MPESVSADHIAVGAIGGGEYEPQRKNNWLLRVAPPLTSPSLLSIALDLVIHSFDFPKVETESIPVRAGNKIVWFPTTSKVLPMTLVITDYLGSGNIDILWRWNQLVYDLDSSLPLYPRSVYAVSGTLFLLSPEGKISMKWKLHSIWPSKVDLGGGDMDSSDVNRPSIVLQCDSVEPLRAPR